MSLPVASGTAQQPQPLPSLPSTPTEEDLGGVSVWKDANDEYDSRRRSQSIWKTEGEGKGKAKLVAPELVLEGNDGDVDYDSDGTLSPNNNGSSSYPPKKDEEEESRRIQENLKRWEENERQRRKAARESTAITAPTSVIGDVSRRASLLWNSSNAATQTSSSSRSRNSGSLTNPNTGNTHFHTALPRTSEDALPLRDLTSSPAFSPTPSPLISKPPSPTTAGLSAENPFEPPDSATPLRGFPTSSSAGEGSAVMRPSSPPLISSSPSAPSGSNYNTSPPLMQETQPEGSPFADVPDERTLQQRLNPPPPKPLDLPPPKTPPPRTSMSINSPPSTGRRGQMQEEEPERRWWTDWLCGCREGGDNQAGRTNPFE